MSRIFFGVEKKLDGNSDSKSNKFSKEKHQVCPGVFVQKDPLGKQKIYISIFNGFENQRFHWVIVV
jgi:hypothetical protein